MPCSPKKVGQLDFFGFQGFIISIPNPNIKGCPRIFFFVNRGKMVKAQPSLGGPRPRFGGGGIGGLGYLLEHHNLLG